MEKKKLFMIQSKLTNGCMSMQSAGFYTLSFDWFNLGLNRVYKIKHLYAVVFTGDETRLLETSSSRMDNKES